MVNDECENPAAETQENSHDLYRSSFTTQHSCLLHFSVRDTGIGIPDEKRDSLFHSFSQVDASITRKFGGTGLGLAISKQLAEMMGGTVGLESVEGRGSTFWFTVRLGIQDEQQEERPAQLYPQGYPNFSGTKARILVAEDNIVNQQVALGFLKKMGLRADAVANGREAIHALGNIPYDLVLMDVQMPEMDGLEATQRIRASEDRGQKLEVRDQRLESESQNSSIPESLNSSIPEFRIPIIAMTAGAMQEDRERCFEAGMDDYIAKPVSLDELARVLSKWLLEDRGQRAEDRSQRAEIRGLESEEESQLSEDEEQVKTYQDLPMFDRAALLDRFMGDEDFVQEVLGISLENIPQRIQKLQTALDVGDAKATTLVAHTIKGMAANIGSEALRALARELESAARDGNLDAVRGRVDELKMCYEQLRTVIEVRHLKAEME